MRDLTLPHLLFELDQRDIHITADGDQLHVDAPAGSLTSEMRQRLATHKTELLAYLKQQTADEPPGSIGRQIEPFRKAIRAARQQSDLEQILPQAQSAYERGDLVGEEVETLAILAAQEARRLPEKAKEGESTIWAEDLLPGPGEGADTCPCSG